METSLTYTPFILLGIFMFISTFVFIAWGERWLKKDNEKMASFLRHMEIESQKNTRETQRKIDENHADATRFIKAMHKETSLILGRISR